MSMDRPQLIVPSLNRHWPAGRKDAVTADPGGRLPAETLSATDLKAAFADKGLDTHDLVVLSGAHTVCILSSQHCMLLACAVRPGHEDLINKDSQNSAASLMATHACTLLSCTI